MLSSLLNIPFGQNTIKRLLKKIGFTFTTVVSPINVIIASFQLSGTELCTYIKQVAHHLISKVD